MNLSELKNTLSEVDALIFKLPDGRKVPSHFHVTEVGKISKDFIDCGGTRRKEEVINLQLWSSIDIHHRLQAQKLKDIISLSEEKLGLGNHEIEVEYQGETIGKYGLDFNGQEFELTNKQTDCLAKADCGLPTEKIKRKLSSLTTVSESCCTPGGGCC